MVGLKRLSNERVDQKADLTITDVAICLAVSSTIAGLSVMTKSFWGDEILSIEVASQSLAQFVATLASDYHPPFYFLLLKVWILFAGVSEPALRVFQGMQGFIFLLFSLRLFRQLLPGHRFHPAWLLLITSAEFWLFMPMLRYYIFTAALVVFSTITFFRWMENPDRKQSFVLTLSFVLLLYTDYPASIVPAVQFGHLIIHRRERLRTFIKCGTTALVLFLPWSVITLEQIGKLTGLGQVADLNLSVKSIPVKFAYSLYAFLLGETVYPFEIVAVAVIGLCIAMLFLMRIPLQSLWLDRAFRFGLITVGVGVFCTSIITTYLSTHTSFMYTPSRTLYALVFIYLIAGSVLAHARSKIPAQILLVVLILSNVYGVVNWALNRHFLMPVYATPWKEVVDDLEGKEGLLIADESLCYEYYQRQRGGKVPKLVKPATAQALDDELRTEAAGSSPVKVFVLMMGRESTEEEVRPEIIGEMRSRGRVVSEQKYLRLDETYRAMKRKLTGRDAYDSKLRLQEYEVSVSGAGRGVK